MFVFYIEEPRSSCYWRTAVLKAYCATLWGRRWRWWGFFYFSNLMEHRGNEIYRGKPTTRRRTCPSATLSTTNRTWTDPRSNPGPRGERPATNRLSHGTATLVLNLILILWEGKASEAMELSNKAVLRDVIGRRWTKNKSTFTLFQSSVG
jgi:hypothetical protein